ncbi:hypothetical protein HY522_00660 [bacterium]|nr:hypothetical protein [bacterium]
MSLIKTVSVVCVVCLALSISNGVALSSIRDNYNQFGYDPSSFVPPNQIQLKVSPTLSHDVPSGEFIYSYKVESLPPSKQKLFAFEVETEDRHGFTADKLGWSGDASISAGFRFLPPNFVGSVLWSVERIELAGREITTDEERVEAPKNAIGPGENVSFSFRSKGIPTVRRFWARGWVRPYFENEVIAYAAHVTGDSTIDNMDAILDNVWDSIPSPEGYRDAYQGKILSARIPPSNPVILCDTFILDLIGHVREAAALGWIKHDPLKGGDHGSGDNVEKICHRPGTPAQMTLVVPAGAVAGHLGHGDRLGSCAGEETELPEIARAVIADLAQIREDCLAGRFFDARRGLRGLIALTRRERGKTLTDEAYYLIRFNAEFLLEKL